MRKIDVVAAIIYKDKSILCVQRNNTGEVALKWEFPGGKIEKGETHKEALIREIKEELDCDINVNELFVTIEHKYKTFKLVMHCYECTLNSGKIMLKEHIDSRWLATKELETLDWAAADVEVVRKIKDEWDKNGR